MNLSAWFDRQLHSNGTLIVSRHNAVDCGSPCSLTTSQSIAFNLPPWSLAFIMIFINLIDLLVFRLWRDKLPYILFHQVLAYSALGRAFAVFFQITIRMLSVTNWTTAAQVAVKVFGAISWLLYCYSLFITTLISIDRWLCTDFVVTYRNVMTRKKAHTVSAVAGLVCFVLVVPTMAQTGDVVQCDEPLTKTMDKSRWQKILFVLASGSICGPILILTQARILMVVIGIKLRLMRRKRRLQSVDQQIRGRRQQILNRRQDSTSKKQVVLVAIKSSTASIVTVLLTMISVLPSMAVEIAGLNGVAVSLGIYRLVNLLTVFQHLQSLPVYIIFFPEFRGIFRRLIARMLGDSSNIRVHHMKQDPTTLDSYKSQHKATVSGTTEGLRSGPVTLTTV